MFGLFFGTAGVATIDNMLRHGYPAVFGRSSYRWFLRLVVVPLVLASLVLGAFVVYVHFIR